MRDLELAYTGKCEHEGEGEGQKRNPSETRMGGEICLGRGDTQPRLFNTMDTCV